MSRFLAALSRILLAVPRALRRIWRRSLWLRVTATTLVLSIVVVGVLGLSLLSRVTTGLLDAKERISVAEVALVISCDSAMPPSPQAVCWRKRRRCCSARMPRASISIPRYELV